MDETSYNCVAIFSKERVFYTLFREVRNLYFRTWHLEISLNAVRYKRFDRKFETNTLCRGSWAQEDLCETSYQHLSSFHFGVNNQQDILVWTSTPTLTVGTFVSLLERTTVVLNFCPLLSPVPTRSDRFPLSSKTSVPPCIHLSRRRDRRTVPILILHTGFLWYRITPSLPPDRVRREIEKPLSHLDTFL